MLNPRSLKIFHLITENGSLAAAANKFNLSPPAASRLISLLEAEIGFDLFSREGRNLTLTENGIRFLRESYPILSSYESITKLAEDIKSQAVSQLRVLATAPCASAWVAPALKRTKEKHKELVISVEVVDRLELQSNVGSNSHDISITSFPISDSVFSLEAHSLCQFRYEAVFSKGDALGKKEVISAEDLISRPLISLFKNQIGRTRMDEFFQSSALEMQPHIETSSSLVALSLCQQDLGVTIMPSMYLQGLEELDLDSRPVSPEKWITFGALTSKADNFTGISKEFTQNLLDVALSWPGTKLIEGDA